ncbi:MAG: 5-dehydro-4-deoxy-D-glucuronate isomerase [Cellulomonadaceae bacterium]|jgi:4-deoxy-L-threo-5-hexosulose-uronate ketol-isomerase|nr:5-dehydro-4-deoxy-D-glucuronate isomerase [Cellulomonadaceae bacterium]
MTATLDQRYATNPDMVPLMDTAELRDRYLVDDLFAPGEIRATYTHHDRIILAGIVPAAGELTLPTYDELRTENFLDNREAGIINIGGHGTITADGQVYDMPAGAVLYIGRGTTTVTFTGAEAAFYLFSATAHTSHPTVRVLADEGNVLELGDITTSNRRTIRQMIVGGQVDSCQVVMGVTTLHEGSMWNTMPAHTHDRRTECYLYYGLNEDARVIHLMGEPEETRHLVMKNREAVISPSWSVHSGVGTAAYTFVWAMAGENQDYTDMDVLPAAELQ